MSEDTKLNPWEEIARPENAGTGFAIPFEGPAAAIADVVAQMPNPSVEHGVFFDDVTGNFLIVRPNADGVYDPVCANKKRVR